MTIYARDDSCYTQHLWPFGVRGTKYGKNPQQGPEQTLVANIPMQKGATIINKERPVFVTSANIFKLDPTTFGDQYNKRLVWALVEEVLNFTFRTPAAPSHDSDNKVPSDESLPLPTDEKSHSATEEKKWERRYLRWMRHRQVWYNLLENLGYFEQSSLSRSLDHKAVCVRHYSYHSPLSPENRRHDAQRVVETLSESERKTSLFRKLDRVRWVDWNSGDDRVMDRFVQTYGVLPVRTIRRLYSFVRTHSAVASKCIITPQDAAFAAVKKESPGLAVVGHVRTTRIGLFRYSSRLNHECGKRANAICIPAIDGHDTEPHLTVQATSPIGLDEEIVINYLSQKTDRHMDRDARRRVLLEKFGFECQCQRCSFS